MTVEAQCCCASCWAVLEKWRISSSSGVVIETVFNSLCACCLKDKRNKIRTCNYRIHIFFNFVYDG